MTTYNIKLIAHELGEVNLSNHPESYWTNYRMEGKSAFDATFKLLKTFSRPVPVVYEISKY